MSNAALLKSIEPSPAPLSTRELEEFISSLPAVQRAAVAWTVPVIKAAVRRLQTEPLTSETVTEATKEVLGGLQVLRPAIGEFLGSRQTAVLALIERKLQLFREYFNDAGAADAAEWAFRAVLALGRFIDAVQQQAPGLAEMSQGAESIDILQSDFGGLLRAQVLIVALADLAEVKGDQARAGELADLAYLEAARGVDAFAGVSIRLDPFQGESSQDRAARVARYAEHVRGSLSDEDERIFAEARANAFP